MAIQILITVIGVILSAIIAYLVTNWKINSDKRKSKVIILRLIYKYIISFDSCFDQEAKILRRDQLTKKQYVRILQQVESGLIDLGTNPYYRDLVYQFPKMLKFEVSISREIERNEKPNAIIHVNEVTLTSIIELYKILKQDFPKKDFSTGGQFYEYDNYIENLVKSNPNLFNVLP